MEEVAAETIGFHTDGLYIFLTDLGHETLFHWGLYLAQGPDHGVIFQMINGPTADDKWEYQCKVSDDVPYSKTLLVAVKIGVIEQVLHQPLANVLAEVPVDPPVTCRVWLHRALHTLDDMGFVKLIHPAQDIEDVAADSAFRNRTKGQRSIEASEGAVD